MRQTFNKSAADWVSNLGKDGRYDAVGLTQGSQKVVAVNDNHIWSNAHDFQRETLHAFGIGTAKPIFKMNIPAFNPAGIQKSPL